MRDLIRAVYNRRSIVGSAPIHVVRMYLIIAIGLMHLCLIASTWCSHFKSASRYSPKNFTTFSDVIILPLILMAHSFFVRDLLFLNIHNLHFSGANCYPLSLR
jgi:hypothetical protein